MYRSNYAYATAEDVEAGFRDLTAQEKERASEKLKEAAVLIDSLAPKCTDLLKKKIVSCNMVRRAIGDADTMAFPIGATQGSVSALNYSQSWTVGSGGSVGELYLTKTEKKMLGIGGKTGFANCLGVTDD